MSVAADGWQRLRQNCRDSRTSLAGAVWRHLRYRARGKDIFAADGVRIIGLQRLELNARLKVGLDGTGFSDRSDKTLLHLRGTLAIDGAFAIGRGCRFDIGPGARARFGGGYVNPCTRFVIMHGLEVGEGCAISWECQFIDEDFHRIDYPGRPPGGSGSPIRVGRHVWVGAGVKVLKGAVIPDGCVVAAGTVVSGVFDEPNCLLAGTPARVVKRGVSWR